MDQSCNSVYKSFKIFPDLYCKNWMFSSCVPSAYKDGHYFVQSGELFNSAEINIKRGKCWQGKGQSFSLFLQAEDMGWSAKYQKYVSILLLKLTYYLIAWLTSNDHETYSSGKQLSSLVTNSAPLHILSCSSSQLNINGNRFCFKIFTDPTAIIVIWVEKFEGAGRVHKFRIGYPKFSFLFFSPSVRHSQYSGSFSFLIFPASLHCQDFKSWKSRDYQLLRWQSLALWIKWGWVKNQCLFFLLLL